MITVDCRVCGEPKTVHCTPEEYERFSKGWLIQNAMPNTPKEERELLISGTCGECWQKIFRREEEDDDDERIRCAFCGSTHVEPLEDVTPTGSTQWECYDCGELFDVEKESE